MSTNFPTANPLYTPSMEASSGSGTTDAAVSAVGAAGGESILPPNPMTSSNNNISTTAAPLYSPPVAASMNDSYDGHLDAGGVSGNKDEYEEIREQVSNRASILPLFTKPFTPIFFSHTA